MLKVYLVWHSTYAEDGASVVAANSEEEAEDILKKSNRTADAPAAFEIPGALSEGLSRVLLD